MTIASHSLYRTGELKQRVDAARAQLTNCNLCPRNCGVNRLSEEVGVCRTGAHARVASYAPHFGEEAPLVGSHGSGTIFFASCSLHCCFCQNYELSHVPEDYQEVSAEQLAAIMLELQRQRCHNINLVTPSHVVPQILEAILVACAHGLKLPIIYNSSGYDAPQALKLLDGVIDIYMPDFKFWSSDSGKKYCNAADYPETARKALLAMHRQVGDLRINSENIAEKGLLVRHLVMPGGIEETKAIVSFIAESVSPHTYVNIMEQYRPCGNCSDHPELQQPLSGQEYQQAIEMAKQAGLTRLDQRNLGFLLRNLGIR